MFEFKKHLWEKVWNDDHTQFSSKHVGVVNYTVDVINDETIRVTRENESKDVLVRRDWEFVYSLKKGYIRARDQAQGLYEHLKGCVHEDGTVWNSANLFTVCDWVIDEMKPIGKRPPMTMNIIRLEDALKWSANSDGSFVDIGDEWDASAQYRKNNVCYAYLRNLETNTEYELSVIGDMTKAQFAKMATNDLWEKYEKVA